MEKIDFVLLWVDGNDSVWQEKYKMYCPEYEAVRFRDWDMLHYWFRGVERFAPWVNKIHLITDNQTPNWLKKDHPKLNLVNHTDYIPEEYLPTFNSNVIEMNMHRIKDLAEHFVLFNDDFYLINHVSPYRFFYSKGVVRDMAALNAITPSFFGHALMNNVEIVNKYFSKHQVLRNNFTKWFNFKLPIEHWYKSLCLLPWGSFQGFNDPHLPQPFLKTSFAELWNEEEEALNEACENRLRSRSDLTQYLVRYWQLVQGKFKPISFRKDSKVIFLNEDGIDVAVRELMSQKKSIMVINDAEDINFELCKESLKQAFNSILPQKSSFEK